MPKKYRKKITPLQKQGSRRCTIYKRNTSGDIGLGIFLILLFIPVISLLSEQQYLPAVILFSLIGLIGFSKFTEVQKLDIFEHTMFVEYIDVTKTYKAEDVETIEWISSAIYRPYFFSNGYYQLTPALLIQTKSGKKIRIPPPGGFDIQESLLEWRDKYQLSRKIESIANE